MKYLRVSANLRKGMLLPALGTAREEKKKEIDSKWLRTSSRA
jgi:hypothetical protein